HRAEYGAIHLLVAGRHFHYGATLATSGFGHLQRPQSLAARLRPHFLKQAWFNVVVLVEGSTILLEGNEDFVHEFTDLHPQPFALFGQIEIHIPFLLISPDPAPGASHESAADQSVDCR